MLRDRDFRELGIGQSGHGRVRVRVRNEQEAELADRSAISTSQHA